MKFKKKYLFLILIILGLIIVGYYFIKPIIFTDEVKFSGIIKSVNDGCFVDGTCSLQIDNKTVVIAEGWNTEPQGKFTGIKISDEDIGKKVDVYAKRIVAESYTIIGDEKYYIKAK